MNADTARPLLDVTPAGRFSAPERPPGETLLSDAERLVPVPKKRPQKVRKGRSSYEVRNRG